MSEEDEEKISKATFNYAKKFLDNNKPIKELLFSKGQKCIFKIFQKFSF